MNKYIYEGKNKDDAIQKALEELNEKIEDIIVNIMQEKSTLLKKSTTIEVIKYNDLIDYVKNTLGEILALMGIKVNFEIMRRDNILFVNLFSDNNSILIGKNGRNVKALQDIIKQILFNQTNNNINIIIDVENYKKNRAKHIEKLSKNIAREVAKTKIEVKMDSMNSYERRIVHNILSDNKYVYTESVGEEPNRCVVIKPKNV